MEWDGPRNRNDSETFAEEQLNKKVQPTDACFAPDIFCNWRMFGVELGSATQRSSPDMESTKPVCVVDDEPDVRASICEMLTAAGYATTEAADGDEALHAIERKGARLAVIDIFMPNREGLSTIGELKRRFPEIPILAISGGGSSGAAGAYLDLARELGADDVLQKPFRRQQLLDKIKALVEASA